MYFFHHLCVLFRNLVTIQLQQCTLLNAKFQLTQRKMLILPFSQVNRKANAYVYFRKQLETITLSFVKAICHR